MQSPTTDTGAASGLAANDFDMQDNTRSCRLQVFDASAARPGWRDIQVVTSVGDDQGDAYFWRFEEAQPTMYFNMVEAFEEVTSLLECFRPLRVSIVLNANGERLYDSASSADVCAHPEFYVMAEPEWAATFAECLISELPAQALNATLIGKQLYREHRQHYPGLVAANLRSGRTVALTNDEAYVALLRNAARSTLEPDHDKPRPPQAAVCPSPANERLA